MQNDYPHKLRKIIKAKNSHLSEEKIDKITDQFAELGLLLVRLGRKQHSKHAQIRISSGFHEKSRDPPE